MDDGVVDGVGEQVVVDGVDGFHHLSEVEVADEDGGLVVPEAVDGRGVSPEVGVVDDVVVDECAGVQHFDGGGGAEDGVCGLCVEWESAAAGADECEQWSQLFSFVGLYVCIELLDDGYVAGGHTVLCIVEMLEEWSYGELDVGEVHSFFKQELDRIFFEQELSGIGQELTRNFF